MQKFLVRALAFVVIAIVLDRVGGLVLDTLFAQTRTGQGSGVVNEVLANKDVDVVFFGSSRAVQHFDPRIVEETTGLSGYNAGANGQGIPYARGVQALLLGRKAKNRCHVLHIDVVDVRSPRMKRVALLAPFAAENPEVLELITRGDPWARVKSWSALWRYNSVALSVLRNLGGKPSKSRGFKPKKARKRGFADDREFVGSPDAKPLEELAPEADQLLREFVAAAVGAGVRPIWITSPMNPTGKADPQPLSEPRADARRLLGSLADELGVTYLSYDEETHAAFRDPSLFVDKAHLHADGAKTLTRTVSSELARLCGS